MTLLPTADLLDRYRPLDGRFDELFDGDAVRGPWARVARTLDDLGSAELTERTREARRLLVEDGVTYNATAGEVSAARPWMLDPVPVVVSAEEWSSLEKGLAQRAQLLDLVLADLYGPRRLLAEGLIPPEVVFGHPGFLRGCDQVRLPGDHQLFHAAFDLGRADDGGWVVLSDRTQAPSGVGYALENRVVVSRVLPELYRDAQVVRLAPFFRELRAALQRVAPASADSPRIVVLSPGPWSETAFEHGSLASYLGYPLVQGSDLRVRDGRVWVRTLGRLEPVHVILRRVDAAYCDPLELRPDSTLGVPGLLEACRVGNVSVVNTFGSGVLENPGLLPFLPELSEKLLGEPLRLPSTTTWWCGDPTSLPHVLGRLEHLVLKSVSGPDPATVLGWELSADELNSVRAQIERQPHAWVGQEPVALSSAPTFADGRLEPRRSIVRGFVVAGDTGYAVMPGGLTRVARQPDEGLISSQNGAWSKDLWVLAREPERLTGFWLQPLDTVEPIEPETSMSQRAAENLFWLSRYAERAEDLVRQLRVVSDRITEFAQGTNPAGALCVEVLLAALTQTSATFPGFVGDGGAANRSDPAPEIRALLVDPRRQGSVAHSVRRLLDAANQVRDQLSNDTWLVIGHLDRDLADLDHDLPLAAVNGALGRVMGAMLALSGLSAESMVRDDGWQFMEAGRRIERALQVCALLGATVTTRRDAPTDSLVIESVLTGTESIITYRRRYRSYAQVETLLDLLVLDGTNPRSLVYQVERLADAVGAMPQPEDADRQAIKATVNELFTLVALADTNQLASFDEHGQQLLRTDGPQPLWSFLQEATTLLNRLGRQIDQTHFSHQLPQRVVAPTSNLGRPFSGSQEPGA